MTSESPEIRQQIVLIARHWVNTPIHHRAQLYQVGVDCAHLVSAVFGDRLNLLAPFTWPDYSEQWWVHTKKELLIEGLTAAGFREIKEDEAKVGDILTSKVRVGNRFGCFGHAAVIVSPAYPMGIIHADPYLGRVAQGTILHPNFDIHVEKRYWTIFGEEKPKAKAAPKDEVEPKAKDEPKPKRSPFLRLPKKGR